MTLELESSRSVRRLTTVLRSVKQETMAKMASLPDGESARYRYMRDYTTELDRLILGSRKGGRIVVRPLAERLASSIPVSKVFTDAHRGTARDLNNALGLAGPLNLAVTVPLIDKQALAFLEDYKLDLITKVTTTGRADIRSALRLGIVQGDGVAAVSRQMLRQHRALAGRTERIVRTELARARAEGHRRGYQQLGVTRVEIIGIGIDCPICGKYIGKVYRMDSAPRLPLHPNCRCDFVAVEIGDGNWLITQRQLDYTARLPLPDEVRITPAVVRRIAETSPRAIYAWPSAPDVLTRGRTTESKGVTTYSLRRPKPFVANLRTMAIDVSGKRITDARLN